MLVGPGRSFVYSRCRGVYVGNDLFGHVIASESPML